MKIIAKDLRRLIVLLYYFSSGKKKVHLSSLRLSHLLRVPEVRVLELLNSMVAEGHIDIIEILEEILLKKETKLELKQAASPYEERCRIRHAEIGRKWGFDKIDYVIYNIAAIYKRERERRTTIPYMPFALRKDPRKQHAWSIFKRTYEHLQEYGWDADRYIVAQAEETAWCKAFSFFPVSWLGNDKSKERMFQWLEKSKMSSVNTRKDTAYEQSKYLVENIMKSRKDCKTVLDVLAIPGVLDQLSADYLQDAISTMKSASA